jgi:imidazole glycerol phosphate synthase, glutamine amidotransferase subunit
MITIIDYGLGNLFSLKSSLEFLDADVQITSDKDKIAAAEKIILPGVGAFGDAMARLSELGLESAIIGAARAGTPLLGICLGMQLLFEESEEYGPHKGLSLISGAVKKLDVPHKIPHMGWNKLLFNSDCPLVCGVDEGSYVYYVHSFYADGENAVAYSDYGVKVAGIVANDNVYGTQFHPEKSGEIGLKILKNFCEL